MKEKLPRCMWVVCASLLLSPWCGRATAAPQWHAKRADVVARLEPVISLRPGRFEGAAAPERKAILDRARRRLKSVSREIFPPTVSARTRKAAEVALGSKIALDYADPNYIDAAVRRWLMDIKVLLAFSNLMKELPPATRAEMESNVREVAKGIEARMCARLSSMFSSEEIAEVMGEMTRHELSRIGHPTQYAYRAPLAQDGVQVLIKEFDKKLVDSLPRIRRSVERWAELPRGKRMERKLAEAKRHEIRDLAGKAFRVLAKRTVDRRLAKIDPDDLAPGYRAAVAELSGIRHALRMKDVEREHAAEAEERHGWRMRELEQALKCTPEDLARELILAEPDTRATTETKGGQTGTTGAPEAETEPAVGAERSVTDDGRPDRSQFPWALLSSVAAAVIIVALIIVRRARSRAT